MYQPVYFKVQELVPPSIYDQMGDRALILLDDRAVITLDSLREHLGKCIVNDWCFGGHYEQVRNGERLTLWSPKTGKSKVI